MGIGNVHQQLEKTAIPVFGCPFSWRKAHLEHCLDTYSQLLTQGSYMYQWQRSRNTDPALVSKPCRAVTIRPHGRIWWFFWYFTTCETCFRGDRWRMCLGAKLQGRGERHVLKMLLCHYCLCLVNLFPWLTDCGAARKASKGRFVENTLSLAYAAWHLPRMWCFQSGLQLIYQVAAVFVCMYAHRHVRRMCTRAHCYCGIMRTTGLSLPLPNVLISTMSQAISSRSALCFSLRS